MTKEEPKEVAPDVVEKKVSEPTHDQEGAAPEDEKPKSEPTSDDEAFADAMNKYFDEKDAQDDEIALYVREKGYLHGGPSPKSLEIDPEPLEVIVDGARESELSTTKETAKAIEEEGKSARSQGTRRSAQVTSKAGSPGKGVTDSTKKVKGRRTAGRVASRHASATGRSRRSRGRGAELRDPGVRVHHAGQSKIVTNKPRSKKQTEWHSPDDSPDFDPDEADYHDAVMEDAKRALALIKRKDHPDHSGDEPPEPCEDPAEEARLNENALLMYFCYLLDGRFSEYFEALGLKRRGRTRRSSSQSPKAGTSGQAATSNAKKSRGHSRRERAVR